MRIQPRAQSIVATMLIANATLLNACTSSRHSNGSGAASVSSVARILDDFHDAAADADGARYFAHFDDEAVFLGTDDTERWTVEQFRAYAEPYFSRGQGWRYDVVERHISFSEDGRTAWFDEKLDNAKWGRCRGSGVLVRAASDWKIAQYNLTAPIPNDLFAEVTALIKEWESAQPTE